MSWSRAERPTAWMLRRLLSDALADLSAGRRVEFVVADLLEALKEVKS